MAPKNVNKGSGKKAEIKKNSTKTQGKSAKRPADDLDDEDDEDADEDEDGSVTEPASDDDDVDADEDDDEGGDDDSNDDDDVESDDDDDDEDGIVLDASDVKDKGDLKSPDGPAPGLYHAIIESSEFIKGEGTNAKGEPKKDSVKQSFRILAGKPDDESVDMPAQVGMTVMNWLYMSDNENGRKQVMNFAVCQGLLELGKKQSVKWGKAVGNHVVIKVIHNEYNGRVSSRLDYNGIFELFDDDVIDVPLDMKALEEDGIEPPKDYTPVGTAKKKKNKGKMRDEAI